LIDGEASAFIGKTYCVISETFERQYDFEVHHRYFLERGFAGSLQ
jgi:hypothetical protein